MKAWDELNNLELGENCGPECDLHDKTPLLQIKNLTVAYNHKPVLQDLSLDLAARQIVSLIGPNGAGKSTLLKSILGLTNFRGQVIIDGKSLKTNRKLLAYVPQKEEVRWDFPVSVADVVMMGRYRRIGWLRRPSKQDWQKVEECLEKVSIADLRNRQISQLSGGQQQRVFVARALAQEGQIILLDEPLTGIDTTSQEIITKLLVNLRNEGKLIMMATHDLTAAAHLSDACALINKGLIAYGTPQAVFQTQTLTKTFGSKVITVSDGATLLLE